MQMVDVRTPTADARELLLTRYAQPDLELELLLKRFFTQGAATTRGGATSQIPDRNVGWRIDYFLVSAGLRKLVTAADIHSEIMGRDHCPVSITLS
ncbi:MAG: hypothetical protein M3N50_14335 [Pseudomonadota bacterium]|nr:hypothetical protein [Pseudomonadota bacterium]